MTPEVLFQTRGSTLIITFNRPEKGNALNVSMAKTLCDKFKILGEDRSLRAVLLRGAGNTFMDGYEMSCFSGNLNTNQEAVFQRTQFFFSCIRELAGMERPVIAAVDGRVSGAGLSLMLASDFVLATTRTVVNAGFTKFATMPDAGATFFLPRKIGVARATEMLLLNEDVDARKAFEWGLVNRVVDPAALEEAAYEFTDTIAKGPTRIIGSTKRLIGTAFEHDLNAHLAQEASTWTLAMKTFDFREGIGAYMANREPKYTGA